MSTASERAVWIRPATPEDVDDIYRLIVELAVYEKEPDAVTTNVAQLRENIFDKGYAECLIAKLGQHGDESGETVGMALYFFSFSTWLGVPGLYLEDLYVTPKQRNLGLGKALFGELGKVATAKGCGRIEWRVLKWNAPSIAFYEKTLGATPQSEWEGMRLEGEQITALQRFAL